MPGEERVRPTSSIPVEVSCAVADLTSARHAFTAGEWTAVVTRLHSAVTYLLEAIELETWPPASQPVAGGGAEPVYPSAPTAMEARVLHQEIGLALTWDTVRSSDARRFLLRTGQLAASMGIPESSV
jgi:hypothetical protein